MARTKGVKKELLTILKSIEYRNGQICKMSDGTMRAIITVQTNKGIWDEFKETVENRSEGQAFIDSVIQPVLIQEKSRRTKGVPIKTERKKELSGPHAGWMKNPPEHCTHKVFDQKKEYWVDVYFCAYKCNVRHNCPCAELLMQSGKKQRKVAEEE